MVYEDPTNQQANQKLVGNEPSITGSAPIPAGATAPIQKFNQANQVKQADVDPNQQKQGSGAFTNIRKYLNANVGGAEKLGQKIQTRVGQEAQNIRQGIEQSQQKFQGEVGKIADVNEQGQVAQLKGASDITSKVKVGTIDPYGIEQPDNINIVDYYKKYVSPDKADEFSQKYTDLVQPIRKVYDSPGRSYQVPTITRQPMQESPVDRYDNAALRRESINKLFTEYGLDVNKIPKSGAEQIASDPELLKSFRALQTGAIPAPEKTLTGAEIKPLEELAKATQTEGGRFGLLKSTFRSPNQTYTSGQQSLDQLFLQAAPKVGDNLQRAAQQELMTSKQTIDPALEQQAKLLSDIDLAKQKAQQDIASSLGGFELDEKGQLKEGATGELGSLYKNIYDTRKAAQDTQQAELVKARQMLEQGQMTNETAKLLGLDPGANIYNINLADYKDMVNLGDSDITMADVIKQDEANRLKALSQLANYNINLGEKEGTVGPQFGNVKDLQNLLQTKQRELSALDEQIGKGYFTGPIYKDQYGTGDYIGNAANQFNAIKSDPNATPEEKQNAFNNYVNAAKQAQYDATILAQKNNQLFGRVDQEQYYNNLVNLLSQYGQYNPFRLIGDTKQNDINLKNF